MLSAHNRNRRLRHLQEVRKHLTNRWNSEYVVSLSTHHRMIKSQPPSVGDVMLFEEPAKKHLWKMTCVLLPGSDGLSGVVRIKTATGVLLRPVQCLVPLELSTVETMPDSAVQQDVDEPVMTNAALELRRTRTREVRVAHQLNL